MTTVYATLALLILAALLSLMTVAFLHLRRRHRAARNALNRVRQERDAARWALAQSGRAQA